MADKYINSVGVQTIKEWAKNKFALDSDLDTLNDRVDDIVSEGGEPNTIESISVNGTTVTPDAQKNVNISVPKTGLGLSSTGSSQNFEMYAYNSVNSNAEMTVFASEDGGVTIYAKDTNENKYSWELATKDYVTQNGGKIDKIKVNNVEQTIDSTDKSVNINAPTRTSDLTNNGDGTVGSAFATQDYVGQNSASLTKTRMSSYNVYTISKGQDSLVIETQDMETSSMPTAIINGISVATIAQLANSGFQTANDVQNAINQAVASAYKYKGSVANREALPSNAEIGDVYDLQDTGMNVAWTGSAWDNLGTYVDTSVFWTSQTGQTNTLEAMTVAEINAILNAE